MLNRETRYDVTFVSPLFNEMGLYFGQMFGSSVILYMAPVSRWKNFFSSLLMTSSLYYKSLTIIIYDHIDGGQYYKTMIMIVSYAPHLTLALSSVINYDLK